MTRDEFLKIYFKDKGLLEATKVVLAAKWPDGSFINDDVEAAYFNFIAGAEWHAETLVEVGEVETYEREGRDEIYGDVDQHLHPGTKLYIKKEL